MNKIYNVINIMAYLIERERERERERVCMCACYVFFNPTLKKLVIRFKIGNISEH